MLVYRIKNPRNKSRQVRHPYSPSPLRVVGGMKKNHSIGRIPAPMDFSIIFWITIASKKSERIKAIQEN